MGYQTKIRLTIIALTLATCTCAQEIVYVKGIVADSATNKPIPYVNVVLKKSQRGTMSDKNGNFAISARPDDTIQFSSLGYRMLELPARDWEPSVVMLTEIATMLKSVTVEGESINDPYAHLFDEQNANLKKMREGIPFYKSRDKKEKIMLARAKAESVRVKNYVELLVKDEKLKNELIKKHRLTETEYYDILVQFNQKNYAVMYYLDDSELLTLLYRFYEIHSPR